MSVAKRLLSAEARTWARGVLVADATILANVPDGADSVFGGDPRQGATRPYGVVQVQVAPRPLRKPLGEARIWSVVRLLVKWVGRPADFDTLLLLANRADELLEGRQHESAGDSLLLACLRDGEYMPPADELSGELTMQVGAFYAVTMQEVA